MDCTERMHAIRSAVATRANVGLIRVLQAVLLRRESLRELERAALRGRDFLSVSVRISCRVRRFFSKCYPRRPSVDLLIVASSSCWGVACSLEALAPPHLSLSSRFQTIQGHHPHQIECKRMPQGDGSHFLDAADQELVQAPVPTHRIGILGYGTALFILTLRFVRRHALAKRQHLIRVPRVARVRIVASGSYEFFLQNRREHVGPTTFHRRDILLRREATVDQIILGIAPIPLPCCLRDEGPFAPHRCRYSRRPPTRSGGYSHRSQTARGRQD